MMAGTTVSGDIGSDVIGRVTSKQAKAMMLQ